MTNLFQKIGAAFTQKGALPVGRAGRSFLYGLLPGAKVDYRKLAGDLSRNSVVAASVQWIGRNLPQAPPCVYKIDAKGKKTIDGSHPLAKLLNRPNPYYSGHVLRQATMLSLIVSGNAYWYVVRRMDGTPKELWYLPHFQVKPVPGPNTDAWITGYEYTVDGQTQNLKFEDVIHFRDGLDPLFPWLGLSPLASAYREVVTDNEAAGYAAAILKNMGIPGVVITPKEAKQSFSGPEQQVLKDEYEESTQGDNRGRPMVLTGPVEIKTLALSPEQLLLDTAQDKPEERLCALIGVPPGVLQLGVGIKKSTFSNRDADRQSAWYECIIPRLDIIHEELDVQLLPAFGNADREKVGADTTQVRALQEAQDTLYTRLGTAVGGPFITANEARSQINLPNIDGGDALYPPTAGGGQPEPNEPDGAEEQDPASEDTGDDDAEKDKPAKKKPKKDKKAAGLTWWQRVASEIESIGEEAVGETE